jgi:hypothetical protein
MLSYSCARERVSDLLSRGLRFEDERHARAHGYGYGYGCGWAYFLYQEFCAPLISDPMKIPSVRSVKFTWKKSKAALIAVHFRNFSKHFKELSSPLVKVPASPSCGKKENNLILHIV